MYSKAQKDRAAVIQFGTKQETTSVIEKLFEQEELSWNIIY